MSTRNIDHHYFVAFGPCGVYRLTALESRRVRPSVGALSAFGSDSGPLWARYTGRPTNRQQGAWCSFHIVHEGSLEGAADPIGAGVHGRSNTKATVWACGNFCFFRVVVLLGAHSHSYVFLFRFVATLSVPPCGFVTSSLVCDSFLCSISSVRINFSPPLIF